MVNKYLNRYKEFQYYSREILSPILKCPKFNFLYLLIRNFGDIVGEKYKNYCKIEKVNIVNENRQGIIYIIAFNSSCSFYINNRRQYITEKINTIFGYDAVVNIFVKEIPTLIEVKSNKKVISEDKIMVVRESLKNVKNEELKESLLKLGSSF